MNVTFPGRYKHQNVSIKIKLNPALNKQKTLRSRNKLQLMTIDNHLLLRVKNQMSSIVIKLSYF